MCSNDPRKQIHHFVFSAGRGIPNFTGGDTLQPGCTSHQPISCNQMTFNFDYKTITVSTTITVTSHHVLSDKPCTFRGTCFVDVVISVLTSDGETSLMVDKCQALGSPLPYPKQAYHGSPPPMSACPGMLDGRLFSERLCKNISSLFKPSHIPEHIYIYISLHICKHV